MRDMNSTKSAVKRMREYEDKILLLHLFSFQLRIVLLRRELETSAFTVGLVSGMLRLKL